MIQGPLLHKLGLRAMRIFWRAQSIYLPSLVRIRSIEINGVNVDFNIGYHFTKKKKKVDEITKSIFEKWRVYQILDEVYYF